MVIGNFYENDLRKPKMQEKNFLSITNIHFIHANDYKDTIEILLQKLESRNLQIPMEDILKMILEREDLMPTSIGYGIAIPHTSLSIEGKEPIVEIGILENAVNWFSFDKIFIKLVILVLYNKNEKSRFYEFIGLLNGVLKDKQKRKILFHSAEVAEIYDVLRL